MLISQDDDDCFFLLCSMKTLFLFLSLSLSVLKASRPIDIFDQNPDSGNAIKASSSTLSQLKKTN